MASSRVSRHVPYAVTPRNVAAWSGWSDLAMFALLVIVIYSPSAPTERAKMPGDRLRAHLLRPWPFSTYVPLTQSVFTYELHQSGGSGGRCQSSAIRCTDPQYFLYLPVVMGGPGPQHWLSCLAGWCSWSSTIVRKKKPPNIPAWVDTIFFKNRWGVLLRALQTTRILLTGWILVARTILVVIATFLPTVNAHGGVSMVGLRVGFDRLSTYRIFWRVRTRWSSCHWSVCSSCNHCARRQISPPHAIEVSILVTLIVLIPALFFISLFCAIYARRGLTSTRQSSRTRSYRRSDKMCTNCSRKEQGDDTAAVELEKMIESVGETNPPNGSSWYR